jgi:hypothetical protein
VLSHHFGFARIFAVPFRADHLALAWRWLDLIFEGFERLRHARCSPAFTLIYIDTPAAFSYPKKAGRACISCVVQWTCHDLVFVSLIIPWRYLGLEDFAFCLQTWLI